MTLHSLAFAFAYVGALLSVSMVVPQIARTLRHPTLGGVSPIAWSMSVIGCSLWLTYGLRTDSVPQIPGNILLVIGATAVVLLVPSPASRLRRAVTLGVVLAAFLAVAWRVPPEMVGYLAFAVGFTSSWPQLYDSVKTYRAGAKSGVSISAWVLRAASQVAWLTYALLAGDTPVAVSATMILASSSFLVVLEWLAAAKAEQPSPRLTAVPASVSSY
jgi:uncharacterized protein with PQ loop repeat